MKNYLFPKEFVWGVATASYQIEGGVNEGGRGESIWDRFSHIPGNTRFNANGDIACDHYHRWREDVAIMRELGLKSYRFSIAWPRVFPNGYGEVNEEGVAFYSELVDALLANGIEPCVTLYHWDLPQALQDEGGWTNRNTAGHYAAYCKLMFERLGGRVKRWVTLNEPWVVAFGGYFYGDFAPGVRDFSSALQAAHTQLLGHGMAVQLFREMRLPGEIGITLNLCPREGATASLADASAAARNDGFANRWFLDPLFKGGYPADMQAYYRGKNLVLPKVNPEDMRLIAEPVDFLGVNYYNVEFTKQDESVWPLAFSLERGPYDVTNYGWPIVARGLRDLLVRLHSEYGVGKLFVTENGASFLDVENIKGEVLDDCRIDYVERHLMACHEAVEKGVNLAGYYVWTLTDNFEWNTAYTQKFGLVYLRHGSLDRVIKKSGRWYAGIVKNNGILNKS